jgi:uncharacterized surface protein with fasciclin (FAS1) repeats
MKRFIYKPCLLIGSLGIVLFGIFPACNLAKDWDEHFTSINTLDKGVLDIIRENPEYSFFYDKLIATGYDSLLKKDQYFTMFVPVNEAFSGIPEYSAEEWKNIIGFHICYANLLSRDFSSMNLQTSIGKYLEITKKETGEVDIFNSKINPERMDMNCRNGIVHEIDQLLVPQKNIYEYIMSLGTEYSLIKKYLNSMNEVYIDLTKSTRIGVDDRGNTIYDTVWARKNQFLDNVARINIESNRYTAILIKDSDVEAAIGSAAQYFGDISELDEPTYLQILSIVYSAAFFTGLYQQGELPSSLVSVVGKTIQVSDLHFSSEVNLKMSNGLVHVLDGFNIPKEFFLYPIIMEADNKTSRRVSNTVYSVAIKSDSRATNGTYFQYASKAIGDYVEYKLDMVLATRYWLVWTGPALGGSYYQLSVDGTNIGPQVDNYYKGNFKPVESGFIDFDKFGTKTVRISVVGQTIPGYNSIYLDYIKLVPDELYKRK